MGHLYAEVEFDAEDVATRVEQFGVHEWDATRFRVLGRIRNISLRRTLEHDCDFYFIADVDNFVRPCTLLELVALNCHRSPDAAVDQPRGLFTQITGTPKWMRMLLLGRRPGPIDC